jgi:hypothetical protein
MGPTMAVWNMESPEARCGFLSSKNYVKSRRVAAGGIIF